MSADLLPLPDELPPLRLYTGPDPTPDPPLGAHPERTRRGRTASHAPDLDDSDPLDAVLALHPELLPDLDEPGTDACAAAWSQIADSLREDRPRLYSGRPQPPPTRALPGTPEKIEVMRERVAAGLAPCSPGDATFAGAVGLQAAPTSKNGAGANLCLDGTDRRAAATTGRQAGSELSIRAKLDAAREERRTARKAAREARRKAG